MAAMSTISEENYCEIHVVDCYELHHSTFWQWLHNDRKGIKHEKVVL